MSQDAGQGAEGGPSGEKGPNYEDQPDLRPRGLVPEEVTEVETMREGTAALVPRK